MQSADDCGTTGSVGWHLVTNGSANGWDCVKCVENECPTLFSTSCSGQQQGAKGDSPCYSCGGGQQQEHCECICVCPNGYWYSLENGSNDGIYPGSDGYNPNGDYGDYDGDCEEFGYNGQWCSCPSRPYRNSDPNMIRSPGGC